jgi:hypothetical protein
MSRLLRLPILLCFLTAITSNLIQATQISLDPMASLVTLLDDTPDAAQNDDSVFLVTDDDDSDDADRLIHAETEIDALQPFRFSPRYPAVAVTAVPIKSRTVLRL